MSTGPRLPLASAKAASSLLMAHLGLKEPDALVVGSIRREKVDIGDIEIIAPMPYTPSGGLLDDTLYHTIKRKFWKPLPSKGGQLVLGGDRPPADALGRIIQGHNPLFKQCDLEFWIPVAGDPALESLARGETHLAVKVNIFRYLPGANGNRGWIEVLRTGSSDFGETGVLSCWKFVCGTLGLPTPGSKDGFLVDSRGNKRATPNEYAVFQAIGCLWVPPHLRTGPEVLCRVKTPFDVKKRTRAMELLGIETDEDVAARWVSEGAMARRGA
jgi:hypothetical protein